jgi:hypothetical protein
MGACAGRQTLPVQWQLSEPKRSRYNSIWYQELATCLGLHVGLLPAVCLLSLTRSLRGRSQRTCSEALSDFSQPVPKSWLATERSEYVVANQSLAACSIVRTAVLVVAAEAEVRT